MGERAVWVLPLDAPHLLKVDAETNRVVTVTIPEKGSVQAFTVGSGRVWVPIVRSDGSQVIEIIDASTNRPLGSSITANGGVPFAVGLGRAWLLEEEGAVHGLNTESLEIDASVVFDQPPAQTAVEPTAVLDEQTGSIWVANYRRSVTRIDLR